MLKTVSIKNNAKVNPNANIIPKAKYLKINLILSFVIKVDIYFL